MPNVDREMAKGALWMVLARLSDRVIGLVSTIVLVRLLAPDDFGLVAMGTSVIAVCEVLGKLGLDVALIQNREASRDHYDTAWTVGMIFSTVTALFIAGAAVPAANFYGEARLSTILYALALGSLISGFENIGIVAFRKNLQFNKEFQFIFGKKLAGFIVALPLAWILQSYWALIAGIVASRLAGVALSYAMERYRPTWSLKAMRELFHFSKWMALHSLCATFNSRAADFVVGKFAGARDLGIFNVSYEISNLPTSELVAPINRAVFPGYALKASDTFLLKRSYLDVLGMIAACGTPIGVGISVTAYLIVPLLLGDKWIAATPLVALLGLYGVLSVLRSNAHYVFLAQGKPEIATSLGLIQVGVFAPALVALSISYGALGAAYAYFLSEVALTAASFTFLSGALDIAVREIVAVVWRPLLAATGMYIVVQLTTPPVAAAALDLSSLLLRLGTAALAGSAAYVTILFSLWSLSARPLSAEAHILRNTRSVKAKVFGWFEGVSTFYRLGR